MSAATTSVTTGGRPLAAWRSRIAGDAPIVGVLTALALAVRLAGIDESLFGDELFTIHVTAPDTPGGVLREVRAPDTEVSPPLFFLLSWAARRLGDPDYTWVRAPSLLLGTATVPLVYALGVRTVGRRAALVGAALMALLPFGIFYSTEARPYATLAFLLTLSTLALTVAVRTGRRTWWLLYALAAVAALYAHYTGIFVIGAQALWALLVYRERRRELVLATGVAAVAYLPWLPYLSGKKILLVYGGDLTVGDVAEDLVRAVAGSPYVPLATLPGRGPLIVLGVVVAGALAGLVVRALDRRKAGTTLSGSRAALLIVLLALATPVGLLVYTLLPGPNLFMARNLNASLPAAMLLLGAVVTALPRLPAIAATAVTLAVFGVGAAWTLDPDTQRPPLKDAAEYLDAHARPGEPVIDFALSPRSDILNRGLQPYFERPHPVYQAGVDDHKAWRAAADGRRVFMVLFQDESLRGIPKASGPGRRFPLIARSRLYPGTSEYVVLTFARPGSR